MLEFKITKNGEIFCKIEGSAVDITQNLILCIGSVHESVKQKSEESAMALRAAVERFCRHGSYVNNALFEHFMEPEMMNKELKQENERLQKKVLAQMLKSIEEAAGAMGVDEDNVDIDELMGLLDEDEDEDDDEDI